MKSWLELLVGLLKVLPRPRRPLARYLRAFPLVVTLKFNHWLNQLRAGRNLRRCGPLNITPLQWFPGLSVIIPERGGADLLRSCLEGLFAALADVEEQTEVIIVVNGSARGDYQDLAEAYPSIHWLFFDRALGFSRAVIEGVAIARHGGIYLLNNDMRLQPGALHAVLGWRGPAVFSVGSQILFPDDGRRREETGWTFMPMEDYLPQPYHAVSSGDVVRGTVWAGAGSSLYHAQTLRQLLPDCLAYDPFYWEDVDLGLRAHRAGYESLYCSQSRALHLHRVTVRRYYEASEVERIFERNRLQLVLRGPLTHAGLMRTLKRISHLEARSLRELSSWLACRNLWRARQQAQAAAIPTPSLSCIPLSSHRRLAVRPLLMVTPFAILPPRHGGAMRSQRTATALAKHYSLILLSDEGALYGDPNEPSFHPFDGVYLVDGRPPLADERLADRISRMDNHAHRRFRQELCRLIELHRPQLVLVEHMELAPLVEVQTRWKPPFWLSLHDVLLQPDDPEQAAADQRELELLDRFNGLIVCSEEDQALLGSRDSILVRNGCDRGLGDRYRPSCGRNILFIGPFRAAINWTGISDFVRLVYPQLRAELVGLSLTIVGGPGAKAKAGALRDFADPSIEILETVDSLACLLERATLTINPQPTLRGSSLKVLESIATGRVCVTTQAGARGHLQDKFAGLISCTTLSDFGPAISGLILDDKRRHRLEKPDPERLAACSWDSCTEALVAALRPALSATVMAHDGASSCR